jgi:hypothetical protein
MPNSFVPTGLRIANVIGRNVLTMVELAWNMPMSGTLPSFKVYTCATVGGSYTLLKTVAAGFLGTLINTTEADQFIKISSIINAEESAQCAALQIPNKFTTLPAHVHAAQVVTYDHTSSGLTAAQVQAAVDELKALIVTLQGDIADMQADIVELQNP